MLELKSGVTAAQASVASCLVNEVDPSSENVVVLGEECTGDVGVSWQWTWGGGQKPFTWFISEGSHLAFLCLFLWCVRGSTWGLVCA